MKFKLYSSLGGKHYKDEKGKLYSEEQMKAALKPAEPEEKAEEKVDIIPPPPPKEKPKRRSRKRKKKDE